MPRVLLGYEGHEIVTVNNTPVDFSYWPMRKTKSRQTRNSEIFTSTPWENIKSAVLDNSKNPKEIFAFLRQAEDFYNSQLRADILAARPLLLYYYMLNLAKAFILFKGISLGTTPSSNIYHGLTEDRGSQDPILKIKTSNPSSGSYNIFDLFYEAYTGTSIPAYNELPIASLKNQSLVGHRSMHEMQLNKEKFVQCTFDFVYSRSSKSVTLRAKVKKTKLQRLNISRKKFLDLSNLNSFKEHQSSNDDKYWFIHNGLNLFNQRPVDCLNALVDYIKPYLWVAICSSRPYRTYFVYLGGDPVVNKVLPQPLSMYALMFYYGTITRYRPLFFEKLMNGRDGPFISTFIDSQQNQFLYIFASEFAQRDVSRPSLL